MQKTSTQMIRTLVFAGALLSSPVFADKPSWADDNKSGKHQREGQQGEERGHGDRREAERHFDDHHRAVVHDYFEDQHRAGRCPPGLAKKHNGCLPPGQAKKWAIGQPLPKDMRYYDLPPRVAAQLGAPPEGHRYVRVAADILLIATGTGMVVDAIEDLGRK